MKAYDDRRDAGPTDSRNASQLDDPRVVAALDEYLAALEAGRSPDRQEFLSRHSAIAGALAECLEGMEALHQAKSAPHPQSDDRRDAGPTGAIAYADWQPGMPLGDYRLLREIGRGGMGVVYEAEQLSLGRRIALKVLPFALTLDPRQLQRFKNEARAAAQLHHQHIVPVYAVGSERGVHFYAMQYIEGQSLAEVIHDLRRQGGTSTVPTGESTGPYVPQAEAASGGRKPPVGDNRGLTLPVVSNRGLTPPARHADTTPRVGTFTASYSADSTDFYRSVARLGVQAAEALEHAHEYGVIHRDIKPGNLMVDAHGRLWVTDFGLAQFQTDAGLTQSGDLLGTLRYMSPEQASGQRLAIDHRTDIYSLGATLYELLTLHPPFEGNNRHTLLHQIVYEEPCPPRAFRKSIPAELETIVLKALAKSPAERYASAQELADDLSRFLHDQPIRARRATVVQRLRKWARRHPSFVWAAVVLCLLTVAGSLVSAEIIRRKTEAAYRSEKQRAHEAEDNYRLAREAVDGMFQLCEEELAGRPFLDGLRRRLLQDYFLIYYQKLIDNHRDDPEDQAKLSAARERVLVILNNLAALQGMGQYRLLNLPGVMDDLQPTQMQHEQILKLLTNMKARLFESRSLSPDERIQRFLTDAKWMENEAKQLLTVQQQQRLRQIDLQFKGIGAFEEPEVVAALHLDASQREKIRAIQAQFFFAAFGDCHPCPSEKQEKRPSHGDLHKQPFPLPGGARKAGSAGTPLDPLRQIETNVLTQKQQQQWRELRGQPFTNFDRHPHGPHRPPPQF